MNGDTMQRNDKKSRGKKAITMIASTTITSLAIMYLWVEYTSDSVPPVTAVTILNIYNLGALSSGNIAPRPIPFKLERLTTVAIEQFMRCVLIVIVTAHFLLVMIVGRRLGLYVVTTFLLAATCIVGTFFLYRAPVYAATVTDDTVDMDSERAKLSEE